MINLSDSCVILKAACAITKQFPKAVITHMYVVLNVGASGIGNCLVTALVTF
jgi:hypothetical protein